MTQKKPTKQTKQTIRLHYSRPGAPKGLPWTLHTSKACLSAAHVIIQVPIETEEAPHRKTNPRYFLKCRARIEWDGRTAVLV